MPPSLLAPRMGASGAGLGARVRARGRTASVYSRPDARRYMERRVLVSPRDAIWAGWLGAGTLFVFIFPLR